MIMNNWLNRITKTLHQNRSHSQMIDRYSDLADWIYDPDLSAVTGHPAKHWTITGDTVSLMSQIDRDAVDAAEAQAFIDADRAEQKSRLDEKRLLRGMAVYFAKELNKLEAGTFTTLTAEVVKQGVKDEVDNV